MTEVDSHEARAIRHLTCLAYREIDGYTFKKIGELTGRKTGMQAAADVWGGITQIKRLASPPEKIMSMMRMIELIQNNKK